MLGSYMEDIGITSSQFEAACGVASEKIKTQFHHALFEQVFIETFKQFNISSIIIGVSFPLTFFSSFFFLSLSLTIPSYKP